MSVAVNNPLTAFIEDTSSTYTASNASSLTSITLNGTDVLGGAVTFVVSALPRLVSCALIAQCRRQAEPVGTDPLIMDDVSFGVTVQGMLYGNSSTSSVITTVPSALYSSVVYYAPLPYRYSNIISPVTLLVEDSFGFATVDNNDLASPTASAPIVSSLCNRCNQRSAQTVFRALTRTCAYVARSTFKCRLCRISTVYGWRLPTLAQASLAVSAMTHCCSSTRLKRASSTHLPRRQRT